MANLGPGGQSLTVRAKRARSANLKAGDRISDELSDRLVSGVNLMPGSLGDQLGEELTVLVFLRYFGCIFCRETLADMRDYAEKNPEFPKAVFFYQGSPTEGRAFLRRYWPEVRAIADPEQVFYEGFGVQRGSLIKMFGPGVFAARSRAAAKGHGMGERSGDIWRMPGAFLARGRQILWAHEFRHSADHPSYEKIAELASEARLT